MRWGALVAAVVAVVGSIAVGAESSTATTSCASGAVSYVAASEWTGYQCMDVARPTTGAGPFPAVIFVHGGGWSGGSYRSADYWRSDANALAARGYVTFNIEYDRASVSRHTAHAQEPLDVANAVRHVRANAATYGIDPDRVGLVGDSAGGQLALLTAYTEPGVAAVVSWSGPGDMGEMTRAVGCGSAQCAGDPNPQWVGRAVQAFEGFCLVDDRTAATGWGRCPDSRYQLTSPLSALDASDPPTLLAAATEDKLVPFAQHRALADAARAVGVGVREVVVPGGSHGRGMRETANDPPGLWAAETVGFLDDCVKAPPCSPSGTGTATTTAISASKL